MRMHPPSQPRATESHAERALYAALSKSPLAYTVFHSLKLRTKDGWEGEGDFVIVDPQLGLLVLEVKGGAIELREGLWFQNGKPLHAAPKSQAWSFVKNLIDELKKAGCETPPYGIACAFPDCDFSDPPNTGDLRGVVLGKRDLSWLDESLPKVFATAVRTGRLPQNRKWIDKLKELWGHTWVPTVSLEDRVADAERRSVSLDGKQYELLEYAEGTGRALVEGAAGTGKTLVAMELCRRRAAAGLKTQYLCFTDALAKAVRRDLPTATSVRQLAVELLKSTGAPMPHPDKKFWDEVSLNAACEALPPPESRPELVVVDEGQDFEPNDWMLVEQLAGKGGLWVFRDQRQAFWTDRAMPDSILSTLGGRFTLKKAYRCPSALSAFAERYVNADAPATKPTPGELRVATCGEAEVVERTRHEVERLLRDGAKPGDISIVTLSGQTRSELFKATRLGSIPLVHADAPDAGQHVVVDTFLRFKGLERPFVVVTELGGTHVTHYATRMHIALTRATVQATVIAPPSALAADPLLLPA